MAWIWLRFAKRAATVAAIATLAACAQDGVQAPAGPAPQAAGAIVDGPIPAGSGEQTANLDGTAIQVFTYRPDGCDAAAVLLVFHGLDRNAGPYRDAAIPLAQRSCMLVVAPLFDEARFPAWRYQRGGVARNGTVLPPDGWTVNLVPRLVAWTRAREGKPGLPYALIGHSAGAQFLSRVAAFEEIGRGGAATRIVVANPSTWVRPRLDVAVPYGLGGAYPQASSEVALRRYLALPITVLLGREDTGSQNLARSDEADEQGATRFERGQTVFAEAEQSARQHGWPFGWRLAVVPGVGHNARRMFTSDAAFEALAPR